jgi:hypothetical protein
MSAPNEEGVDLDALDVRTGANAGFWLTLRDPVTNKPLPAKLHLLGMDSDKYKAKGHELQRRRQQELAADDKTRLTPEQIEARTGELLAAVTVGWSGLRRKGGGEFEYTGEARARELYQGWPWIYEQAHAAVLDRGNFLPGSARG